MPASFSRLTGSAVKNTLLVTPQERPISLCTGVPGTPVWRLRYPGYCTAPRPWEWEHATPSESRAKEVRGPSLRWSLITLPDRAWMDHGDNKRTFLCRQRQAPFRSASPRLSLCSHLGSRTCCAGPNLPEAAARSVTRRSAFRWSTGWEETAAQCVTQIGWVAATDVNEDSS
jgi:hypothetical protein